MINKIILFFVFQILVGCKCRLTLFYFRIMLILFCFIISACKEKENYSFSFDNVEYIEKAKDAIKLSNPINVDLNIIGKTDFTIYEDLCLISGQNNGRTISVYQLPNFNYLGSYVHVGNGPGEVLFPPFVGSISIKQQPDGIHAYFLNLKGGIIDWNVTKSIEAKATIANTTDLRLPNDVVGGIYINDTSLLLKKINNDRDGQQRYIFSKGIENRSSQMEILNSIAIAKKGDGFMFNVLSSDYNYSTYNNKIVEASNFVNTINLYGYANDNSYKTVCLGDELDDINQICENGIEEFKRTCIDLKIYDKFFSVLYSGNYLYQRENSKIHPPILYIFNWDGKLLKEIHFEEYFDCFDIDVNNHVLYTLNTVTDELKVY